MVTEQKQQQQKQQDKQAHFEDIQKRMEEMKAQRTKELENWDWNNHEEKEYRRLGLKVPDNLNHRNKKFLTDVDKEGRYPILRKVTRIFRIKAPDLREPNTTKPVMWEFVYWEERWIGKNNLGIPLVEGDDRVGVYDRPIPRHIYNNKTGAIIDTVKGGSEKVYYIPFSKEAVDKIIARSDLTDKDNGILFYFMGQTFYNNAYSYEQLTTATYDECKDMLSTKGGPVEYERRKNMKKEDRDELDRIQKEAEQSGPPRQITPKPNPPPTFR